MSNLFSKQYSHDSIIPDEFIYVDKVIPSIRWSTRYATSYNFVGRKINKYENNVIIATKIATEQLFKVQQDVLKDGYSLVIYDAYRPTDASMDFINWAKNNQDNNMKEIFYPDLEKNNLFTNNYISPTSSHSRGSTFDLTLIKNDKKLLPPKLTYIKNKKGKSIPYYDDNSEFMGTSFDFFGIESYTKNDSFSDEVKKNRYYLLEKMDKYNFKNYSESWGDNPQEWWHFVLANEPFTEKQFNFTIK